LDQLREEDPQILIFKSGYRHLRIVNAFSAEGTALKAHRTSIANGNKWRLARGSTDPETYAKELSAISAAIDTIVVANDAHRIGRLVNALSCEKRRLKALRPSIVLGVPGENLFEVHCDR